MTVQDKTPRMARTEFKIRWAPLSHGVRRLGLMASLSYVLSVVSLVLGVLLVLLTLALSEGGIGTTGLLIGGVLILNGAVRLWARRR